MADKLTAVKGMNDILPPDSARWEALEAAVRGPRCPGGGAGQGAGAGGARGGAVRRAARAGPRAGGGPGPGPGALRGLSRGDD